VLALVVGRGCLDYLPVAFGNGLFVPPRMWLKIYRVMALFAVNHAENQIIADAG